MIKKSRLEELIKEGATIWAIGRYSFQDQLEEIKLDEDLFSVSDNALIYPDLFYTKMEDLFETEKDAKWALNYQRIPYTEWLDLPMWEEMYESANRNVFYHRKGIIGKIDGVRYPNVDERVITIRSIYARNEKDVLFNAPATEENYIKACDLCVKLFKGE